MEARRAMGDALDDLAVLQSQLELDVERYRGALTRFAQEHYCPLHPDLEHHLRARLEKWALRLETDGADLECLRLPACVRWERVQDALRDRQALDDCISRYQEPDDTTFTRSEQAMLFAAILLALDFDGSNQGLRPTRIMLAWLWRRLAAWRRDGPSNGRPLLWLGVEHAGDVSPTDRGSLRDLGVEAAYATRVVAPEVAVPETDRKTRWPDVVRWAAALGAVVLIIAAVLWWSPWHTPAPPATGVASVEKERNAAVSTRGTEAQPTHAPPTDPPREARRAVVVPPPQRESPVAGFTGNPNQTSSQVEPRKPQAEPAGWTRYVGRRDNANSRAPLVAIVDETGRIDIDMSEALATALSGTVLLNAFVTDGTFDQAFEQNDPGVLTKAGLDSVASRVVLGRTAFPAPIVSTRAGVTIIAARMRLSLRLYEGGTVRWVPLEKTGSDGTPELARVRATHEVLNAAIAATRNN